MLNHVDVGAALDFFELAPVVAFYKGKGNAGFACPAGAANAVNVELGLFGQVVIKYGFNVVDI